MNNVFETVPVKKKGRAVFDERHTLSGNFPLSTLVPVFFTETIPGDSWTIRAHNLTKLETLIAPAMQQIDASLLWFKMPKRLVFKHFKKWYSGGPDGQDDHEKPYFHIFALRDWLISHITPLSIIPAMANNAENMAKVKIAVTEVLFGPGTLWQYLGLPCPIEYDSLTGTWKTLSIQEWASQSQVDPDGTGIDSDVIDAMPLLAYQLLFDEYFRDQSLQNGIFEDAEECNLTLVDEVKRIDLVIDGTNHTYLLPAPSGVDLAEGGEIDPGDVVRLLMLFKRAWQKEYYTSALPSPQRGPEVEIQTFPETAEVTIDDQPIVAKSPILPTGSQEQNLPLAIGADTDSVVASYDSDLDAYQKLYTDNWKGTADLGLSPITITAFRNLFKLQSFLEKNNVAGGRYIETILAHWAEQVPDFTVQRAQHVRSTRIPIQISEVLATANSAGVNGVVGDQAGHAKTVGNLGDVKIYTQEPSFIIGLFNVTVPPAYGGQGIPKMFQRMSRFDEPWTDFQHIGEQAIKTRELYFPFRNAQKLYLDADFGYQQRFSEFKYMPNRVVGDFVTSLSFWHMARLFNSVPNLDAKFVTQNPDERIFAVPNDRPVIADFFFEAYAKRKLSKFSTPKLT